MLASKDTKMWSYFPKLQTLWAIGCSSSTLDRPPVKTADHWIKVIAFRPRDETSFSAMDVTTMIVDDQVLLRPKALQSIPLYKNLRQNSP